MPSPVSFPSHSFILTLANIESGHISGKVNITIKTKKSGFNVGLLTSPKIIMCEILYIYVKNCVFKKVNRLSTMKLVNGCWVDQVV